MHVELLGIEHEAHARHVDDAVLELDAALVLLGERWAQFARA